jgi:hypothetical protein
MNTSSLSCPSKLSGSALLVTVFLTAVLAAAVGTYLALTLQGNQSVKRSIGWNAALPLAEAGVEEALTHVIQNTNGFGVDGWTLNPTNGAFSKQRSLGDGYYFANIAGAPGGTIEIISTGYGCWKGSNYIARTVQVLAESPFPFIPVGIEATNVTFGGTFGADSFDSSSDLYSTDGNYDRSKATALVTVATPGSGFRMSGNSHIRGYVATGPGGSVAIGGSAFVGDENFTGHGIQIGHQTNNFTATYPPVQAPFTNTTARVKTPTNGTIAGTTYTYVLNGGNFFATNLDSASYGKTLYVASNSTLFVTGNIDLSTVVFNTNSTPWLKVYVSAPSVTFSPTVIDGTPPQFWVFGLPSCITLGLGAHTTFSGVIYAPQVNVRANGSASYCGAIVAATFSCLGNFDFHYDIATRPRGPQPFKILSWSEL